MGTRKAEWAWRGLWGIPLLMALLLAGAAMLPMSAWRPLGNLARRAEDVTADRVGRMRQWAVTLALGLGVLGMWMARARLPREFVRRLHEEIHDGRKAWADPGLQARVLKTAWPFFVVLLVGQGLRAAALTVPMGYDEAYSFLNFARRPWYEAMADYNSTNNHLLNTVLMHGCYRVWGQVDWALRLPSCSAGAVLMVAVAFWTWGRHGVDAALLAMTFTGCSAVLVDYSANARGYMFVIAAAVVLDASLDMVRRGKTAGWMGAWLALVLGGFAMPIMLYPLAGSLAWFLTDFSNDPYMTQVGTVRKSLSKRVAEIFLDYTTALRNRGLEVTVFLFLSGLALLILWGPAYVFRGLLATENPFIHPLPLSEWVVEVVPAWRAACSRWIAGPIPIEIWGFLLLAGYLRLMREKHIFYRWHAPWITTLILMGIHRLAPPPRLFLFLTPWVLQLAALGILNIIATFSWLRRMSWRSFHRTSSPPIFTPVAESTNFPPLAGSPWVISVLLMILTITLAPWYPLVHDPEQRSPALNAVPAAIAYLGEHSPTSRPAVLLAPLPCDLPCLYYLAQLGVEIPLNRPPQPGETVWLLAVKNAAPRETLHDIVVQLPEWEQRLAPWQPIAHFGGLTLWQGSTPQPHSTSEKAE